IEVSEQEDDDDALADSVKPETNLVSRLGILCIEVDAKIAKLLPDMREPGGIIVAAKSPAGQGRYIDLEAGDVIHALNDEPVGTLESFRERVANFKTGDPVVLTIERSSIFRYLAFEIE
ncbi:MAG: PDZ domain-containing protein, partial [Bryobacteraceae bacterium]